MSDVRVPVRKPLPLTPADLRNLRLIRQSPEYRDALHEMTGADLDAGTSQASLLHAALHAGLKAVRERAEDRGYAAMPAGQDETTTRRHQVARRRAPAWAPE